MALGHVGHLAFRRCTLKTLLSRFRIRIPNEKYYLGSRNSKIHAVPIQAVYAIDNVLQGIPQNGPAATGTPCSPWMFSKTFFSRSHMM